MKLYTAYNENCSLCLWWMIALQRPREEVGMWSNQIHAKIVRIPLEEHIRPNECVTMQKRSQMKKDRDTRWKCKKTKY